LGAFGSDEACAALLRTWATATGPGLVDIRRGVLTGLDRMLTVPPTAVATAATPPPPVVASATGPAPAAPAPRWEPTAALRERAANLLLGAFNEPDLRLRLQARTTARDTGLLPDRLNREAPPRAVLGMIDIFAVINEAGVGHAGLLAGGIAKALITTAAGLMVAIPTLLFHRFFNSKVNKLAIGMEEQALRLVEVMKGEREDGVDDAS